MSEPYVGEIRLLGFNFPPSGWALCNGAVQSISQNSTLFALLGTTYGGDGVTTFALPDLQSRLPLGMGQGPGLSDYVIGEAAGVEGVTLTQSQMPSHTHLAQGSTEPGNASVPTETVWSADGKAGTAPYSSGGPNGNLRSDAINPSGSSQAHDNVPPFLGLNFSIALFGVFPSRN